MRAWTAEHMARWLSRFLLLCGMLASGMGLFFATDASGAIVVDGHSRVIIAIGVSLIVQSVGMAFYFRFHGEKGVRGLKICCLISLTVVAIEAIRSFQEYGSWDIVLVVLPFAAATLAYTLITRRVEVGDDSPIMPGAEYMSGQSWKVDVVIVLVIAAVFMLICAVCGGNPFARSKRSPDPSLRAPTEYEAPDFVREARGDGDGF